MTTKRRRIRNLKGAIPFTKVSQRPRRNLAQCVKQSPKGHLRPSRILIRIQRNNMIVVPWRTSSNSLFFIIFYYFRLNTFTLLSRCGWCREGGGGEEVRKTRRRGWREKEDQERGTFKPGLSIQDMKKRRIDWIRTQQLYSNDWCRLKLSTSSFIRNENNGLKILIKYSRRCWREGQVWRRGEAAYYRVPT